MDVESSAKPTQLLSGRPGPQASMLNEWADPFPVRQFLDLHMMVRRSAVLLFKPAVLAFQAPHCEVIRVLSCSC